MATKNKGRKPDEISAIMRRVHSTGTGPELAFQETLSAHGVAYQTSPANIVGKPDVVLPHVRLAIFIDGDFWHGGQWRTRGLARLEDQFNRTESRAYWLKKIRRNMNRDCINTAALLNDGWTVLRFWESEIRANVEECVNVAMQAVERGTPPSVRARLAERTVAEFFAGIGLMRLGLEKHGWSITFANDIDPDKEEMYQAHFQGSTAHFVLDDIHQLSPAHVPSVTLATASFPCTDLSLAGGRDGLVHGPQSSAFWGFASVLDELGERRPPLVLIENVTGFLTSHKGKDFEEAMIRLNRLGYGVDAFIIDAMHFVPQSRQRLLVIGVLNELFDDPTPPPVPAVLVGSVRPRALAEYIVQHQHTISWRIRSLPTLPTLETRLSNILDDLPHDDPAWWNEARSTKLLHQMSVRHRRIADHMIAAQTWSYGTVFRRMRINKETGEKASMAELRVDGIAGCLRTPKGGSAKQILFKAGFGQYFARLITPQEAARLMGADGYTLPQSLDQALFGFGDAVCVPVVGWVAEHYLNPLVNEILRGRPLRLGSRVGRRKAEIVPFRGGHSVSMQAASDAFSQWYAAFPAENAICGALVVLDQLQEDYNLSMDAHKTRNGQQVKGVGGPAVARILARFGETRPFLSEGGRTSRQQPIAVESMLNALRSLGLESLSKDERNAILTELQKFCVEKVQEYHNRQHIKIVYEPSKTGWQFITDALAAARAVGKEGPVAQHLVGAKLQLRFPEEPIGRESVSTADQQLKRLGDFQVRDSAFHVTVSPMPPHYQKCKRNVEQGYKAYLLVPARKLTEATYDAGNVAPGQITVASIEQFISQNIEELGAFSKDAMASGFCRLLTSYNERVDAVETDKSLLIDLPPNLENYTSSEGLGE